MDKQAQFEKVATTVRPKKRAVDPVRSLDETPHSNAADANYRTSVMSISTTLSVTLASAKVTLEELSKLGPGSVLSFDKHSRDDLQIEASGQLVAKAKAVQVGDHLGVRIS